MIQMAVVGCGYWGPNLVRNFISLTDCKVKKICDADKNRTGHIKSLYPFVETTVNFDEIINDVSIDAVAVATPVRLHYEMARKCLLAGKHVFVEKPMASSAQQCQELIEIADDKKLTLMVGHIFVYSTPVQRIKDIVKSGELGEIQYVSARRLNLGLFQKDINVAWDLAPHDISIIVHVMDAMPASVNCQGKAHINPDVEDVTNMTLNFSNGAMATIQSSWLDPNKIREITFVGKKKMLVYDDIEPLEKIKIYDKRVDMPPHYDTFGEFQYAYHYGDMHCPYLKLVEPLKTECQHFIESIKNRTKPLTGGPNGLQVVKILEASSFSLKNKGAEIRIVY